MPFSSIQTVSPFTLLEETAPVITWFFSRTPTKMTKMLSSPSLSTNYNSLSSLIQTSLSRVFYQAQYPLPWLLFVAAIFSRSILTTTALDLSGASQRTPLQQTWMHAWFQAICICSPKKIRVYSLQNPTQDFQPSFFKSILTVQILYAQLHLLPVLPLLYHQTLMADFRCMNRAH